MDSGDDRHVLRQAVGLESGKGLGARTAEGRGWTPIGTSGDQEYTRLWLSKHRKPQPVGTGTCSTGRHEIQSKGPFAVTVWGTDAWTSYGYPGGAALRALNDVQLIVR